MGVKITGLDKLMKQLNDPKELAKKVIDNNNGIEIDCPNCQKKNQSPFERHNVFLW